MSGSTPVIADGVRGHLHRPDRAGGDGLVLAHGAGSDADAPILLAAAAAFRGAGWMVLRCDLPFRQRRAAGPPGSADAAADRDGLRRAAGLMRTLTAGRLVLGGHSYGGRQSSMLAAEDPAIADALLLLSYPLHPPKRPDIPRTAHFPMLRVASLFLHGSRDGFGSPDELRAAVLAIPAPVQVLPVPGAGHDLRRGRIDFSPVVAALGRGESGSGWSRGRPEPA